jgi:hypothetical protein
MFFENGIFPGCIVTVGQNPHPEAGSQAGRPVLTNTQRKQVYAAIKRVMGGVANFGNPAIVDGLIESVQRLSMNSEEMGWEKSAAETKTAILSAFAVHPYILGEHMPGSMAQARIIKELFYERVNTFLDMLSAVVTNFVGPAVEGDTEDLVVWWEECQSVDPSLRWSNLNAARNRGDVSRNEIRSELGLPPDESGGDATKNYTAGDVNAIIAIQGAIAQGSMEPEQAREIYRICFDMEPADAKKVAGKKPPEPPPQEPPVGPPGGPPTAVPGQEGILPLTEPEAVSGAAGALEKAVAALGLDVAVGLLPKAVARKIIAVAKELE